MPTDQPGMQAIILQCVAGEVMAQIDKEARLATSVVTAMTSRLNAVGIAGSPLLSGPECHGRVNPVLVATCRNPVGRRPATTSDQVGQLDGRVTPVSRHWREQHDIDCGEPRDAGFQGTRKERSSINTLPANQSSPAGPVPIGPMFWANSMNAATVPTGTGPRL